ncbi:MAG TPA: SIS domain-containing protein [Gammaproteobacteria bacterium]|nr:SIS domain-containing protein [Gammaproteobacteria bacterium]
MIEVIKYNLLQAKQGIDQLLANEKTLNAIQCAAEALIKSFDTGNKVLSCGNGGSMCDAMHFAEELTGRFRKDRRPFPAIAICDPSHFTCVGNDYGFDDVFARYIVAHAKAGDCLLAISTSGTSKNIMKAIAAAKQQKVTVIGLTGKENSLLDEQADISICTPIGEFSDRVQELHIKVIHTLIELVERGFCPENYA